MARARQRIKEDCYIFVKKNTATLSRVRGVVLLLSVAGAAIALAACNTVKGAGTDLTRAGEASQRVITGNNSTNSSTPASTTPTTTTTTTTTEAK